MKKTLWFAGGGLCALALALTGPGLAQYGNKTHDRPVDIVPPTAAVAPIATAAPPVIDLPQSHSQQQSFEQLGQRDTVTLQGRARHHTIPFSVRSDEIVTQLSVRLDLSLPPGGGSAPAPIDILLNDEVIGQLTLPADSAATISQTVALDPRLVVAYNRLTLRLAGASECGVNQTSANASASQWVQVNPSSSLLLTLAPLPLGNDLGMLPAPFFDKNDTRPLDMTLVTAAGPNNELLQEAGSVASWLGSLASYRGARLHHADRLPAGHAIVLATDGQRPAGLTLPVIGGATVTLAAHPADSRYKVLYVLGRDAAELHRAVDALVLGKLPAQGSSALITRDAAVAARQPYDAPRWLRTDQPVRFDEIVPAEALQVSGAHPGAIELPMRLPPDLFLWRSHGVPVDLQYGITGQPPETRSRLTMFFNGRHVRDYTHGDSDGIAGWLSQRLDRPGDSQQVHPRLPADLIGTQSHARMSLAFSHGDPTEDCPRAGDDKISSRLDGGSTVDFSSVPHYLPMPDLAAFANAGFPFTRMADLSQTGVLLPDQPAPAELDTYLDVMGRMGEATGYPARGVRVVRQRALASVADRDLILIGTPGSLPQINQWSSQMGYATGQGPRQDARTGQAPWLRTLTSFWRRDRFEPHGPLGMGQDSADLAAIVGFESPLQGGRSVVALIGRQGENLGALGAALTDPKRIADIRGHVASLHESDRIVSHLAEPTYANGRLPWLTWVRWQLASRPMLLWLVLLGSSVLLAGMIYVLLRHLAQRRLALAA